MLPQHALTGKVFRRGSDLLEPSWQCSKKGATEKDKHFVKPFRCLVYCCMSCGDFAFKISQSMPTKYFSPRCASAKSVRVEIRPTATKRGMKSFFSQRPTKKSDENTPRIGHENRKAQLPRFNRFASNLNLSGIGLLLKVVQ